ncbi:unnamed protein product [Protopolystoma xenopodis]|uniref:Uncharacterized protein n=1 Tax=Protopolystoma xenopodis TaxID=117903 RepID=A0A3S5BPR4_9PLAT|nr:unnamed protein product [Protopolystoma xenopodis]
MQRTHKLSSSTPPLASTVSVLPRKSYPIGPVSHICPIVCRPELFASDWLASRTSSGHSDADNPTLYRSYYDVTHRNDAFSSRQVKKASFQLYVCRFCPHVPSPFIIR